MEGEDERTEDTPKPSRKLAPQEVDNPDGEGSDDRVGPPSGRQVRLGWHVSVVDVPQVFNTKDPDSIRLQRPALDKQPEAHEVRPPRRLPAGQKVVTPGETARCQQLLKIATTVEPPSFIPVKLGGVNLRQVLSKTHADEDRDEKQVSPHGTSCDSRLMIEEEKILRLLLSW
jgi:hypothetical protein